MNRFDPLRGLLNLALIIFWLPGALFGTSWSDSAGDRLNRTTRTVPELNGLVLVLVNSASPNYADYTRLIQPYLEQFGVPYQVLDLASSALPGNLEAYAEIMIGHARIDPAGQYLSLQAQSALTQAVQGGVGLVNFDRVLFDSAGKPLYQWADQIFGFKFGGAQRGTGVGFTDPQVHYITQRHSPGDWYGSGLMDLAGISLPADATLLARSGSQPLLAARSYGSGRAVQWGSYDWMRATVRGPLRGLDDLVWRSIVWAARKPFVLQALPPFLTMRVDDVSGPLWWAHTANEQFGYKPWIGVFINDFSDAEAQDLAGLVKAGGATALVHSLTMSNFFFYNAHQSPWPDARAEQYFKLGKAWHEKNGIPMSKFAVGHFYELGNNSLDGLSEWGVEYIGELMNFDQPYGSPWVQAGPFRQYERGSSTSAMPFYYADDVRVPDHPEYDGRFFNCMTEIRDDAGYEWFPGRDVAGSIERGTRQSRRALDSLVLATLFTHEYHILEAGPQNWQAILKGVSQNLAGYQPILTTLEDACAYARAIHDSQVTGAGYDLQTSTITVTLTGKTAIPTRLYLFEATSGEIRQRLVEVPAINGTVVVHYPTH